MPNIFSLGTQRWPFFSSGATEKRKTWQKAEGMRHENTVDFVNASAAGLMRLFMEFEYRTPTKLARLFSLMQQGSNSNRRQDVMGGC